MKSNLNKIANFFSIILVIASIIMLVSCSKQVPIEKLEPVKNPEPVISAEPPNDSEQIIPLNPAEKPAPAQNLNPNTGNLYEDIKIRLKETLK